MSSALEREVADIERQTGGRVELTVLADGRTRVVIRGGGTDGLAADVGGDERAALRELRRRVPTPAAPPSVFTEPTAPELTAAQQDFVSAIERAYGAAHVSLAAAPAERSDRRPWARITALDAQPCGDCDATGRVDRGQHPPCPIAEQTPDVHADIGADCILCAVLASSSTLSSHAGAATGSDSSASPPPSG